MVVESSNRGHRELKSPAEEGATTTTCNSRSKVISIQTDMAANSGT